MLVGFQRIRSIEFTKVQRDRALEQTELASAYHEAVEQKRSQIQLDNESTPEVLSSQPLLPDDRPDWVAQADSVEGEPHRIAIGTELANTIEECRSKLDVALVEGMHRYVTEHLSKNREHSSKLREMNAAWIREHLMDSNRVFEAKLARPAGTFHQLWVQLNIDAQSRTTIEQWIRRLETHSRAGIVGLVAAGCVACLAIINLGLSVFAKKAF